MKTQPNHAYNGADSLPPISESPDGSTITRFIAALDTETLGISNTSVIYQIGVAWFTVLDSPAFTAGEQRQYSVNYPLFSTCWYLDINQQTKQGSTIDINTVTYHAKLAHAAGVSLSTRLGITGTDGTTLATGKQVQAPVVVIDELARLLKNADEVWINHPSFDVPKLDNLVRTTCGAGLNEIPLWARYRAEMDVHTYRYGHGHMGGSSSGGAGEPAYQLIPSPHKNLAPYRPIPLEKADKHDAQIDALWNLQVAQNSVNARIQAYSNSNNSKPIWRVNDA